MSDKEFNLVGIDLSSRENDMRSQAQYGRRRSAIIDPINLKTVQNNLINEMIQDPSDIEENPLDTKTIIIESEVDHKLFLEKVQKFMREELDKEDK